ncbi:MAG: beta strand repeat-containing protein [Janthinobacterium lividum]
MTNFSSQNHPQHHPPGLGRPLAALGLLLATAGAAQAQTFAKAVTYTAGGSSVAGLTVVDVNRDGKLDMLASNFDDNGTVAVLLGTGTGTFGAATTFGSGGARPVGVVSADVNSDGKLDIVVANQQSGTVAVLLGTGTGSFGTAATFNTAGSYPTDLAVADVNGDSKPDIVVTNQQSGTAAVLLGTGTGSFGTAVTYSTTTSSVLGVVIADVNNDTKPDLVVGTYTGSAVAVLLGTGTGTFGAATTFLVGANLGPGRLALADVNADSQLDIVANNQQSNTAAVLLGTGTGSFGPAALYNCGGSSPQDIAVADVNSDGQLDLLTVNANNNTAGVLPGAGNGTFGTAATFSTGTGSPYPYAIRAADVNGDAKPDLLIANYIGNTLGVLLNTTVSAAPTLTTLNPTSGPVGTSVTLTGTSLTGATGVRFNGAAATTFSVVNATTITATVPTGATTGNVTVTTGGGTSNGVAFTVTYADLVINTTTTIPAGIYNSITVNSPGNATLAGNVTVNTSTTVNSGATLNDGCFVLSGAGNFTLADGGTLGICNAAGISAAPATTGAIQTTGTRSFASDASYVYNGTAAQITGTGLPSQVRNLTSTNGSPLALSQAVSIAQVLTLNAGNLNLNNRALTLLSSASGTALVATLGTGAVSGSPVTVQRYIDPSLNPGLGYRHLASPVPTTVAAFGSGGTTPVVNSAYNTAASPGTVTPFPTIFRYDQSRLATSPATTLSAFDKGWVSPAALSEVISLTAGYTVQLAGGQTLSFTGQVGGGAVTIVRDRDATSADAGLSLVGNPYPAPLDLSTIAASQRTNMDAAFYVFESTSQYGGSYRSYVNGIASTGGTSLVGTAQAFFVRVTAGQTSGSLALNRTNRVTTYGQQAPVRRTGETRPLVQLDLRGASGLADGFVAYAQAGATAGFDGEYDAAKLPNSTGLNLSSATPTGILAIDGRAAFTAATTLALNVGVPAAGTYTLSAASLANLPAGLDAYLRDAATGQTVKLNQGTSYSFGVTAPEAAALLTGRFTLQFSSATPLATAASLSASEVTVYPNPAQGRFTVRVPAVAGASQVQAELLNTLGQVVRRQSATLPAAGTTLTVEAAGLAAGVYTLRLTAGASTLAKRVVVQ